MHHRTVAAMLVTGAVSAVVLLSSGCPPPPPPTIPIFNVQPPNACPHGFVGVTWAYDADDATLTTTPATSDVPSGSPFPNPGGFQFQTADSDTTFTLTARRGSFTPAVQSVTVHVLPNPFTTTLTLPYDCSRQEWRRDAFTELEFPQTLTVQSVTNRAMQTMLIEHGGVSVVLRPGETQPLIPPTRFTGSDWTAHLAESTDPICPGGGSTMPQPGSMQPPIEIAVTSTCPS